MPTTADRDAPALSAQVADRVTIRPLFDGATTRDVLVDGRKAGEVIGNLAVISDRYYRFPTPEAAIAAVVSHALRGWWTGEL